MNRVESAMRDLTHLDEVARQQTWLHRIDARAKAITTLVYVVAIASLPRHAVLEMLPFAAYPLMLLLAAQLPLRVLTRPLLVTILLGMAIGAANPFLDRSPVRVFDGWCIAGGWLSFISIQLRAVLGVTGAIGLIATTGMERLCHGLARLGVPRGFVTQLLFLYRYLFLLGANSAAMSRARDLRSNGRPLQLSTYGSLVGHLLLRTLDRAERIHAAMCCRGFHGDIPLGESDRFGPRDAAFVAVWCLVLIAIRVSHSGNFPH